MTKIYDFQLPYNLETILRNTSLIAIIWVGIFCLVVGLKLAQYILAPFFLALVIGLMLIPSAKKIEAFRLSPYVSAGIMVVALIAILATTSMMLSVPLTEWADRLPLIWQKVTSVFATWQQKILSIDNVREIIGKLAISKEPIQIELDNALAVKDVAIQVPSLFGQILIFIASLYFFIATREKLRNAILNLCISRSLKLRSAKTFRDIEQNVASYLGQITIINIGLGLVVTTAMWMLNVPSPLLWGILASLLNYLIYLGPALMFFILTLVGLSLGGSPLEIMTPAIVFLAINLVEANFVTPNMIGRHMTMNPFIVFLSLVFWLWLWGPVGGFIAVPALLILYAIAMNTLGILNVKATKPATQMEK